MTVTPPALDWPCQALSLKNSHQQDRDIPAQAAKTELPLCERAGTRARSGRPASVTLPQAATQPMPMHARLRPAPQAGNTDAGADRPWPSVEMPTVHTTVHTPRTPSAMRPWTAQHDGLRRYEMTHDGTSETARLARQFAASGPFPLVVAGDGFEPS